MYIYTIKVKVEYMIYSSVALIIIALCTYSFKQQSLCVAATLSCVCARVCARALVRMLALLLPWRRLVLEAEYMQPVDSGRTPDGGRKEGRELSCHTLDGRYIETEPRDERLKRRKPFHRTERRFRSFNGTAVR